MPRSTRSGHPIITLVSGNEFPKVWCRMRSPLLGSSLRLCVWSLFRQNSSLAKAWCGFAFERKCAKAGFIERVAKFGRPWAASRPKVLYCRRFWTSNGHMVPCFLEFHWFPHDGPHPGPGRRPAGPPWKPETRRIDSPRRPFVPKLLSPPQVAFHGVVPVAPLSVVSIAPLSVVPILPP